MAADLRWRILPPLVRAPHQQAHLCFREGVPEDRRRVVGDLVGAFGVFFGRHTFLSRSRAMGAVRHGRSLGHCRDTTRREGRALLRAAIGYRLFLLLLAV